VACALAVPLVWVLAVGLLWANESNVVFRASWARAWAPFDAEPFTSFQIESEDRLLDGVILEHVSGPEPRYWILYFNGAAGSIHRRQVRAALHEWYAFGYNVLSFDYRGFGRNGGEPTEAGLYADARAAYRHLSGIKRVDPSRIVLAGRSLGSAVAIEVATRAESAGLLLFSPIDSVPHVGARLYPWAPVGHLATNQFDALAKMRHVTAPVVIVHARDDRVVPIEAARELYRKVRGRRLLVETTGGHSDAGIESMRELRPALAQFWPPSAPAAARSSQ
jgi:fermentation-respiration switch protein FrsA (DUF1100 family)